MSEPLDHLLDHPESFCSGARVLMLCSRIKDGLDNSRRILRISHSSTHFKRQFNDLATLANPGERIYASAGERDLKKAVYELKRRQLEADYNGQWSDFYETLETRWASCLMAPGSQGPRFWLIDCDEPDQAVKVEGALKSIYDRDFPPYRYPTKRGEHFIVQPFNRSLLSPEIDKLIQTNHVMLWAY